MAGLRGLWNRLGGAAKAPPSPEPSPFDHAELARRAAVHSEQPDADAVDALLSEVETTAMAAYERCGLPTVSGHYRRLSDDPDAAWIHLGADLTPEGRWSVVLHQSDDGARWTYASLELLGARTAASLTGDAREKHASMLRKASKALSACRNIRLRRRLGEPFDAEDMAGAVELGALWRDVARDLSAPAPKPALAIEQASEVAAATSPDTPPPPAPPETPRPKRRPRKRKAAPASDLFAGQSDSLSQKGD